MIQTIYDIVKAHGGELRVVSKYIEGLPANLSDRNELKSVASVLAGSEFTITLPTTI